MIARSTDLVTDLLAERSVMALARQTSAATFTILPEMLLTHAVGIVVLILAAALGIAMMTRQRRFLAMGAWAIPSGSL